MIMASQVLLSSIMIWPVRTAGTLTGEDEARIHARAPGDTKAGDTDRAFCDATSSQLPRRSFAAMLLVERLVAHLVGYDNSHIKVV
jgi:hypothetical protein